jgi:hypothetical protein
MVSRVLGCHDARIIAADSDTQAWDLVPAIDQTHLIELSRPAI